MADFRSTTPPRQHQFRPAGERELFHEERVQRERVGDDPQFGRVDEHRQMRGGAAAVDEDGSRLRQLLRHPAGEAFLHDREPLPPQRQRQRGVVRGIELFDAAVDAAHRSRVGEALEFAADGRRAQMQRLRRLPGGQRSAPGEEFNDDPAFFRVFHAV